MPHLVFFLSADKRGKFSICAAGRELVAQRESQTALVAALFPGCSKAAGFFLRQVFSIFARKNRSRARPPRIPVFRWPRPYPCRHLAVDRRAACSSARSRAPLAEDRAIFRTQPARFS